MKRTHFYNYHQPPSSLSQLSCCLHTYQQHILRTLVARGILFYLVTFVLKSLTILVTILVENRLDLQQENLTELLLQKCHQLQDDQVLRMISVQCLVAAVSIGHLGRGSVTNFLSIYGVKCCSCGRRAAGLQIETIRYGDKKYLSHN